MIDQVITFSKDDTQMVHFPHHDPLVIESQVSNNMVAQILMDNGSSVNIMFKSAYERIELTTSDLSSCTSTLYGFLREGLIPMGQIKLLVTLGDVPRQMFKYCTFMVVDCSSAYNAILGRSTLVEFGVVISIQHMCIKFPTESGIFRVRGDKKKARQCYNVSLRQPIMVIEALAPEQPLLEKVGVQVVLDDETNKLDLQVQDERAIEPMGEVEEVALDASVPERKTKVRKGL
ncbi:uncharacterized protein LOC133814488 [Humulus lupulus]|uniref:uncharacterized protein LOC133814488 n=1 Tax=Humulus lupulus TaxID=3486 RepID=UPI002B406476|nr:uncharacterized protein LOC133814488 [Humulus lupulus]